MRGTVCDGLIFVVITRITPACAGNSLRAIVYARVHGDHPRVCGEQHHLQPQKNKLMGSPPRVRGTGRNAGNRQGLGGITPACAGNRIAAFMLIPPLQDHPRVCGEQAFNMECIANIAGSPPRVRGTVCSEKSSFRQKRITPACAGNRSICPRSAGNTKDHPRVCGEQFEEVVYAAAEKGSPPRVRGTESNFLDESPEYRITPACAGNSQRSPAQCRGCGDHPRVCGEQSAAFFSKNHSIGSPPRVRGTVNNGGLMDKLKGITPACAGNRGARLAAPRLRKDHPRVCGEQPI